MTMTSRHGSGCSRWERALPDGADHGQAHFHAVASVATLGLRHPGHTVVTVSQDLYPHTMVFLFKDTKKPAKH